MKIVVLDALPLDPGDLDWSAIAAVGEIVRHDVSATEEVADRIRGAQVVLTNKVRLAGDVIASATELKLISVLATGYDIVDVAAARERGIVVCNVPAYSAEFTAQTAVALLLELTHHAGEHSAQVHAGAWSSSRTFGFWSRPLTQLAGKTALVVGTGNIGGRVAAVLEAFGMRVVAAQLDGRPAQADSKWERIPLDDALAIADAITLHVPATPVTRNLIDARRLALMKPSVLLVNASRGALVVEDDLAAALRAGQIAGYACDVLSLEPPRSDNPLLSAPNCIVTPHLGWASPEARRKCLQVTADNIRSWIGGDPQNVVAG